MPGELSPFVITLPLSLRSIGPPEPPPNPASAIDSPGLSLGGVAPKLNVELANPGLEILP